MTRVKVLSARHLQNNCSFAVTEKKRARIDREENIEALQYNNLFFSTLTVMERRFLYDVYLRTHGPMAPIAISGLKVQICSTQDLEKTILALSELNYIFHYPSCDVIGLSPLGMSLVELPGFKGCFEKRGQAALEFLLEHSPEKHIAAAKEVVLCSNGSSSRQ